MRFAPQQATFDQIKNTGGLRYFKNSDIVTGLTSYRSWIDILSYQQNIFMDFSSNKIEPFILNHFDENLTDHRFKSRISGGENEFSMQKLQPEFATNKDDMRLFKNLIIVGRENFILPQQNFESSVKRITKLIEMLQKEYHLEN